METNLIIRPDEEREPAQKAADVAQLPSTDFVAVEANLASLGFFSATTKVMKDAKSKVITFSRAGEGGKRGLVKVTIFPSAVHGLPTTADQDKWIAFLKIVERQRRCGIVTNPVGFTSAEMLSLLGMVADGGSVYEDLYRWLDMMTFTGIKSEGALYMKGVSGKDFADITFHVFDQVVKFGKKLSDGKIADRNFVWLSEYQLNNLNKNYTLPIDFETYKRLKTPIAKALVPLLQVWLFASEGERSFTKRYDELCSHLNVTEWKYQSQIVQKQGAALDELKAHGYLKNWKLEKTQDGYKVVFYHGEKYFRDRAKRIESRQEYRAPKLVKQPAQLALPEPSQTTAAETSALALVAISAPSLTTEQERLYKQLTGAPFSVSELRARELVTGRTEEATRQLGAYPLKKNLPQNPGGYIIHAIERRYFVSPAYFEAERKAEEAKSAQARRDQTAACPLCDSSGFRMVKDGKTTAAKKCSHSAEIEARYPSL
jgi:hypothetical protein